VHHTHHFALALWWDLTQCSLVRGAHPTEHFLNEESALEELFRKILKNLSKLRNISCKPFSGSSE
jgi:hypothetical protein